MEKLIEEFKIKVNIVLMLANVFTFAACQMFFPFKHLEYEIKLKFIIDKLHTKKTY